MRKINYDFLREKYADIIDQSDQVCGNCIYFCLNETRGTKLSGFGICEYNMWPLCNYDNEDVLILTEPSRNCYLKERFDEDAFLANENLLDRLSDNDANKETEEWLNAHYYE